MGRMDGIRGRGRRDYKSGPESNHFGSLTLKMGHLTNRTQNRQKMENGKEKKSEAKAKSWLCCAGLDSSSHFETNV